MSMLDTVINHAIENGGREIGRRALEDLQSLRNNVAFYERETKRLNAKLAAADELAEDGEMVVKWLPIAMAGEFYLAAVKFTQTLAKYRKAGK